MNKPSIDQSINQSIDRTIIPPINRLIEWSIYTENSSAMKSIKQSNRQRQNQSITHSINIYKRVFSNNATTYRSHQFQDYHVPTEFLWRGCCLIGSCLAHRPRSPSALSESWRSLWARQTPPISDSRPSAQVEHQCNPKQCSASANS